MFWWGRSVKLLWESEKRVVVGDVGIAELWVAGSEAGKALRREEWSQRGASTASQRTDGGDYGTFPAIAGAAHGDPGHPLWACNPEPVLCSGQGWPLAALHAYVYVRGHARTCLQLASSAGLGNIGCRPAAFYFFLSFLFWIVHPEWSCQEADCTAERCIWITLGDWGKSQWFVAQLLL